MLDPIADKLLVASCLLMLAADGTIRGWSLWAAIVILCREILVSGLREYLAELRVSVPVTQLAKWKTTLQLVAVGFLIAGEAGGSVGRVGVAGGDSDRACPAVAVGIADAVYWLGLFPRRRAASDRGLSVEASLFRLGARAHRQAGGGDRAAGGHRHGRRSHDLAQPSRRGIRPCARGSEGDPRRDRPHARAGRRGHFGRARDRLLPAADGGLARSQTQVPGTI